MPEQIVESTQQPALPGLDPAATPLIGVGLGLTGITLGVRPRFVALPLALTALTALLYRDPERATPDDPGMLFAPADGLILSLDEYYEHRYLHTDAIRIATILSPIDVPVNRSPVTGTVRYVEHVPGEYRSVQYNDSTERNARTYIGIESNWGPLLLVQIAGPFSRRITSRVQSGEYISAGDRISTARFGSRTDLLVQRDSIRLLVSPGQRLTAGTSRIAQVVPL